MDLIKGFPIALALRNNPLAPQQNIWIPAVTNYTSSVFILFSDNLSFINIPLLILTQHPSGVKESHTNVGQVGRKGTMMNQVDQGCTGRLF